MDKNNDIYGGEFIDPISFSYKEDNVVQEKDYEDVDGTTIKKKIKIIR